MRRGICIAALVCAVAVLVLLAGCGGGGGASSGGSVATAGRPKPPPQFKPAIAYVHKNTGGVPSSVLCIMDLTGSQIRTATGGASGQTDAAPAWSLDGEYVYFLRGPVQLPHNQLCRVKSDATGLETVWTFSSANGPEPSGQDMDWLPDGKKLIIAGGAGFFAMDPATGDIQDLCGRTAPNGLNIHAWDAQGLTYWDVSPPDGRISVGPDTSAVDGFQGLIAYEASGPGTDGRDVCFIRVATNQAGLLVRDDERAAGPTAVFRLAGDQDRGIDFSPNGTLLALSTSQQAPFLGVVSVTDNGGTDIECGPLQPRDTGPSRSATYAPSWSPDGNWISFHSLYQATKSRCWYGILRTPNTDPGEAVVVSQDVSLYKWSVVPDWNPKWTPDL
jgi:Tol biopolymer transport system component